MFEVHFLCNSIQNLFLTSVKMSLCVLHAFTFLLQFAILWLLGTALLVLQGKCSHSVVFLNYDILHCWYLISCSINCLLSTQYIKGIKWNQALTQKPMSYLHMWLAQSLILQDTHSACISKSRHGFCSS